MNLNGSDNRPEFRIWIFNNPIRGITEQLEFICLALGQHGYNVSISNRPSPSAINILIENLNEKTLPVVQQFCTTYNKKIIVVMTEHVNYVNNSIYFHGIALRHPSEYMHSLTKRARLLHLLYARNHIRCFIRLGDLPELIGMDVMFTGIPIITLPFPRIEVADRRAKGDKSSPDGLMFSGAITNYRQKVLGELSGNFEIRYLEKLLSRRRRDAANASVKAVLNIPQEPGWKWISTMRILAAWRCGRPVINIGEELEGEIAEFCLNVPDTESNVALISDALENAEALFQKQKSSYDQFVLSEKNQYFPSGLFNIWGSFEGECSIRVSEY
jgi:hypothetical protein